MTTADVHIPVMLERTLELLGPALEVEGAVLVDATLGLGGHAFAALERHPGLRLVGLDRDTEALAKSADRLHPFAERTHLVHTVYSGVREALDDLGIDRVTAVLFDLGVSSMQLDEADRGFAYSQDAPLDMRMDRSSGTTAATIVAEYSEAELRRIFYEYGEEKLAPRYASRIVAARAMQPIERSSQLVQVIVDATPRAVQRTGHPAKRVFQALRIEANRELEALELALPAALDSLALDGRIVVLAYQSLEDRIVKRELARRTRSTAPAGLPVELPAHRPEFGLLVRGAELADDDERARNSRSISVRLRAAERRRDTA